MPPDAPHVVFTWQLATSQPSGAPEPMLSYPPFTGPFAPQIRIATLDGAFEHADYLSSPGTEGWILIPRSYLTLITPTGTIDLSGPSDQIPIGSPRVALTLAFTPEPGSDLRADYHDVVLHKITGGILTTERIFTVTAPRVQLDSALLLPGTDYVFEIRTYKGHVMAPRGDFVPVDYPYGAAVVFSRTVKTS